MNFGIEVPVDVLKKLLLRKPVGMVEVTSDDCWGQHLIDDLQIAIGRQVPTLKDMMI
ncbi:hypothetical protein MWU78_14225 [Arenibacter sp. F26102]|uniref:hypothetical protein n=1 Tax=Arenibacter sp. F26102 TaxID=2926416 RepID=UPI001FF6D308|nr:hypothetical protein [Arenibacter sp. F26102]MCK0146810.1 hypothetical protein [Arenibacter sp. F26102]